MDIRMPTRPPLICFAFVFLAVANARGTEVWDGPNVSFAKANWADWTLASNQDHLTPGVQLTRADDKGLFNIAAESFFSLASPLGTEWAIGDIADYQTLSYASWNNSHPGQGPRSRIDVPSVLHLIAEDIYVPVTITSWQAGEEPGSGTPLGGGVSYMRGSSTQVGVAARSWAAVKFLYR